HLARRGGRLAAVPRFRPAARRARLPPPRRLAPLGGRSEDLCGRRLRHLGEPPRDPESGGLRGPRGAGPLGDAPRRPPPRGATPLPTAVRLPLALEPRRRPRAPPLERPGRARPLGLPAQGLDRSEVRGEVPVGGRVHLSDGQTPAGVNIRFVRITRESCRVNPSVGLRQVTDVYLLVFAGSIAASS